MDLLYAMRWVVEFGLEHRNLAGVEAIGVDEIHWGKGQQYLTMVYQIDAGCRRLLYVGRERTAKTLLRFFHDMGRTWCSEVKFVCSDMWNEWRLKLEIRLGEGDAWLVREAGEPYGLVSVGAEDALSGPGGRPAGRPAVPGRTVWPEVVRSVSAPQKRDGRSKTTLWDHLTRCAPGGCRAPTRM
jgi:hypothetical protein